MYDAGVLAEPPNGPTVLLVKFFEHGLKANFIVSKGLPDFLFSLKETNSQTCQTSRVNDFFFEPCRRAACAFFKNEEVQRQKNARPIQRQWRGDPDNVIVTLHDRKPRLEKIINRKLAIHMKTIEPNLD